MPHRLQLDFFLKTVQGHGKGCGGTCKLSEQQIADVVDCLVSDRCSFPLPVCKYVGKRFLSSRLSKLHKMYNLLSTTTHK